MSHPFRHLRFIRDRLIAQARAGSWGAPPGRTKIRYAATAIDQDGVLLLMPKEPSLAFYYVPLAIVATVAGALAGVLS
jgi:hypothetical protein